MSGLERIGFIYTTNPICTAGRLQYCWRL